MAGRMPNLFPFEVAKVWWLRQRLALRLARARGNPTVSATGRLAVRLIGLRRFDDAEDLVRRGLARTPDDPRLLEQLAFCAHNQGHYREALQRWRRLNELRPDLPMPWCGVASNARELRLFDEASGVVAEALSRFPGNLIVISEAARVHESCGRHAEAVELWARMLDHPPVADDWRLAHARNLMKLHRFDEVEQALAALPTADAPSGRTLGRARATAWGGIAAAEPDRSQFKLFTSEALRRYGDEAFAVRQIAETTADLSVAREVLARMLDRDPADMQARESYVRVLTRSDLVEEAEREIAVGRTFTPDGSSLQALHGLVAMRRQDWETAHAQFVGYSTAHPDDVAASEVVYRLQRIRDLQPVEPASDEARPVPIAPEMQDDPEIRRLLLTFESIGANCEFGIVQRRYGAEPLSLLRWTDTDVPSLLAALAARFDGMGDPDHTELFVGAAGEILIRDRRWHLAMHTFLFETEVSLAALLPKMCRRTAYLRDKLLEDLRAGQKTLVFKTDLVDEQQLLTLHDAFSAFGPVRLLHVRSAAGFGACPSARAGRVTALRPGLFVGRLTSLSDHINPAYDEWIEICRAVEQVCLAGGFDPRLAIFAAGEPAE